MRFSKKGICENSFTVIEYESPNISAAEYADIDQVLYGIKKDIHAENLNNDAITSDDHVTAEVLRRTAMRAVLADEYGESKIVKTRTRLLKLPVCPKSRT